MSEVLALEAHPVLAGLSDARAGISSALEGEVWSLSDGQFAAAVRAWSALRAQGEALLLGLLREVSARGIAEAASSTPGASLRDVARLDPPAARALVALATEVDAEDPIGIAMAAGAVSVPHAQVIKRAVAQLPAQASPAVRDQAVEVLAEQAAILCPRDLDRAGREIQQRIVSRFVDVDDPAEAARVSAEADPGPPPTGTRNARSRCGSAATGCGPGRCCSNPRSGTNSAKHSAASPHAAPTGAPESNATPTPYTNSPGTRWALRTATNPPTRQSRRARAPARAVAPPRPVPAAPGRRRATGLRRAPRRAGHRRGSRRRHRLERRPSAPRRLRRPGRAGRARWHRPTPRRGPWATPSHPRSAERSSPGTRAA